MEKYPVCGEHGRHARAVDAGPKLMGAKAGERNSAALDSARA